MLTNPAVAIRMLITYAICIPLAIMVGYMLTNPMDYGTLGFLGLILALVFSPIFIKWHYPIMVFGLGCPMYVFFLKGNPPLWQVVVIISFGIAIVERTLSSDRRFIRVPSITWPLLFIFAMAVLTSQLTGGIGLNTLGSQVAGGKKYITLFLGIAMFYTLTSRAIPKEKRNFYIVLFWLASTPAFISDLFPLLPSPFNYINLLFPPSASANSADDLSVGVTRLGAFATTASALATFMLVKFGLRGIFNHAKPWRAVLFLLFMALTMLGGFRVTVIGYALTIGLLFYFEKLYRTRMLLVILMGGALGVMLLVPFSSKLPYTYQRALSFIPFLEWNSQAKLDAEGSAEWRYHMWHDLWPQVPQYLLLGKGYAFSALEFQEYMGRGVFANGVAAQMDASQGALALSGDYHSGPLSTLIPFGIWGGFGILWLMAACWRIHYLNFKYSPPELKTVNALMLASCTVHIFGFFFVFGGFSSDVGDFAKQVGFCIALNGGVLGPKSQSTAVQPRSQPLPPPRFQAA